MKKEYRNTNPGGGINRRSFIHLFGGATFLACCPAVAQGRKPLATMKMKIGKKAELNLIVKEAEKGKVVMEVAAQGKKSAYLVIDSSKYTKADLSDEFEIDGKTYSLSLENGDKIVTNAPDTSISTGATAEKGTWKKIWNWIKGAVKWLINAFKSAMKWVEENWDTLETVFNVVKAVAVSGVPAALQVLRATP